MYPTKQEEVHKNTDLLFLYLSLSQDWGMEIKFKKVAILPCLNIKSFSLDTPGGKFTHKQWKDVEFQVTEFDFIDYMSSRFPDLDLDDWHTN